jgi:Ca2+-binding EF-hand superfamily protein
MKYILDPKGSLEFFHRTVYKAFDDDNNGVLDRNELDSFLDTFYQVDSIFAGDNRLPSKEELLQKLYTYIDNSSKEGLTFEEIQSLIAGKIDFLPDTTIDNISLNTIG